VAVRILWFGGERIKLRRGGGSVPFDRKLDPFSEDKRGTIMRSRKARGGGILMAWQA